MKKLKNVWIVFFFSLYVQFIEAQINTDSVRTIISTNKTSSLQKITALNLLAAQYNADSTSQALQYANQAYLMAYKQGNAYMMGKSLLNLAEGYLYNDNYEQSLQYAFEALDIFLESNKPASLAECYRLLGWIFYDSENADFSLLYHEKAYQLFAKLNDEKNIGVSFNAIGLVYQLKNENDSSKKYFEKALAIANNINNAEGRAATLNNLGICENNLKNYNAAINYLSKALSIIKTLDKPLSESETFNQLAYSHLKLGNFAESRRMLGESRKLIELSFSATRKEKLLDNLSISSQLNEALGNYTEAFNDLKDYTTIRNQIVSRQKSDAVAANQLKRETEKTETEIKLLLAQKEMQSFQRNALAIGIVLLLFIGFLFISKIRHKRKKENELFEIRQAMIKKDLDNTLLEKEALSNKLEFKDNELKNYALFISQRNELVRTFIDEIVAVQSEAKNELPGFGSLINKFKYDLEINKDAQDFNMSIEEMHKDFFYNILKQYPDLTLNERRLCGQIRLNLSIKDIASLNNISVKSAEMARYRLRKHFALTHNENLNEFLKKF